MIFLIEYDRTTRQTFQFRKYDDEKRSEAEDERLRLELDLNSRGLLLQREVVVLEALNEHGLRRTHERYFSYDKQKAALLALQERLSWHTVGIIANYEGREGRGIGTGVGITYKGRKLILTAEHVVGETHLENLYFIFRPNATLQYAEYGEIKNLSGVRTSQLEDRVQIKTEQLVISEDYDLAAICVPSETDDKFPIQFFELDLQSATPTLGTPVLMKGYPSDTTRQLAASNDFVVFPSMEMTDVIQPPEGLTDFDNGVSYLMPCSIAVDGRSPKGFSGGGVWYQGDVIPLDKVWKPVLKLGGIVYKYYAERQLLKAYRMEIVRDFLDSTSR